MTDVKERTNGQDQTEVGNTSPLRRFTFQDTGITVGIRKVSPLFLDSLNKSFPPPKPPAQPVDYGDGKVVMEPNLAHPDYEKALVAHAIEREDRYRRLLIKRGVEVDVDPAIVERIRADAQDTGIELPADDHFVYVAYYCVGTPDDFSELLDVLRRRSQPTAEAIAEALATFPGQVPGA